jgi:hypothetical protein
MAAAKQQHIETAAERYRRIKRERAEKAEVFDLPCPSGMVWKVREVDLTPYVLAGLMPIDLATKLANSRSDQPGGANELSIEEQKKSIEFTNLIVSHCAVEPRIVLGESDSPDALSIRDVESDDYKAIVDWAMKRTTASRSTAAGGIGADSLETFRPE